jgi:hypothetical protein
MTPNKRDLKAYARFDGTGRIVPGSLVLRRIKPKVGTWTEVQAYECCNNTSSFVLTRNIEGIVFPAETGILFQIAGGPCSGGLTEFNFLNFIIDNTPPINNINDLVQLLNDYLFFYGVFTVIGPTEISLSVSNSISPMFSSCGTIDMIVNNV